MLPRVLEPEVMDTAEEAADYDAMDHAGVNARFCDDLLSHRPIGPRILDVGTGTALIAIELCKREESARVVAVDLASHMLELAARNVAAAGLSGRVVVERADAKALPYEAGSFATTISNSIVHHIPDPRVALSEMARVTASGGLVFVRDLARPSSHAELDRLVALHGGEPPAGEAERARFERQRGLLRASLEAALTVDEVLAMTSAAGLGGGSVRMTSDRHWTLVARKP